MKDPNAPKKPVDTEALNKAKAQKAKAIANNQIVKK